MDGPHLTSPRDPSNQKYVDMAFWAAYECDPSRHTLLAIYESPSRSHLSQSLQDRLASQIGMVTGNLALELLEKLDSLDRCDPTHVESVGRLELIRASAYYSHIKEEIRSKIEEGLFVESILSDLNLLTIDKDATERLLVAAEFRMMMIQGQPRYSTLPEGVKEKVDSYFKQSQKNNPHSAMRIVAKQNEGYVSFYRLCNCIDVIGSRSVCFAAIASVEQLNFPKK